MAVAQIPNMPSMPDIAGGYARIGEQVAGLGKQIGTAVIDFASAQGKKKLIDEIKVKYPSVVSAYPEEVLMQMDNKELGQRLAAVVGIENAIPKLKEVDPKFSTADIEQMKAEIFKQPDQARTIARDWMAIAEKNRQAGIDKEFLAMPTTTGGQPAMPQVAPHSTAQPILPPEMQNLKGQEYIDAMAAEEAKKAASAPQMPAIPGKPMTKEAFYSSAATKFEMPPSTSVQTFKDKGMQSEKDIAAAELKRKKMEQEKALKEARLKFDKAKNALQQGNKDKDRILEIAKLEESAKKEATALETSYLEEKAAVESSGGSYAYDLNAHKQLLDEKKAQANYWKELQQEAGTSGDEATTALRKKAKDTAKKEKKDGETTPDPVVPKGKTPREAEKIAKTEYYRKYGAMGKDGQLWDQLPKEKRQIFIDYYSK